MFEVTYYSLTQPATTAEAITLVQRAKSALAERMRGTACGGDYQFDTRSTAARFTVRSQFENAIASLPRSIGSPVGHFGQFEQVASSLATGERGFLVLYGFKPFCSSYSLACKRRLIGEIAVRLAAYAEEKHLAVQVVADRASLSVQCFSACADTLMPLPDSFNGVLQRSGIGQADKPVACARASM